MTPASGDLDSVREYWNNHVHDWKVAKSEAGTAAFFREIEDYRFEKLHYLPRVVDFGGYSGQGVLDVGCGVGNDLSRFASGGAQVVGVDLAEHSIALARKNFVQRALDGDFRVMNGEELEFSDDRFDLVYCHTVLHFTPAPERMIREIHRVLRPGGQAIIMTVNRHSWLNVLHRVANVEIDHLGAPVFRQYTAREFREMLAPFASVELVMERFPVATKVHGGLKAVLYNGVFVGLFNCLPRKWVRRCGHHMLGIVRKARGA